MQTTETTTAHTQQFYNNNYDDACEQREANKISGFFFFFLTWKMKQFSAKIFNLYNNGNKLPTQQAKRRTSDLLSLSTAVPYSNSVDYYTISYKQKYFTQYTAIIKFSNISICWPLLVQYWLDKISITMVACGKLLSIFL